MHAFFSGHLDLKVSSPRLCACRSRDGHAEGLSVLRFIEPQLLLVHGHSQAQNHVHELQEEEGDRSRPARAGDDPVELYRQPDSGSAVEYAFLMSNLRLILHL